MAKAEPLAIGGVIGNPKNRVARLGVELEGAWKQIPEGAHLDRDGSVFGDMPPVGHRIGEIPIGPMQPAALARMMRKFYPQKVDATCGMHVHLSFESLRHYAWLMVPEYQETMIEYLSQWAKAEGFPAGHHIYDRLGGKSVFCQKKFWPDEQIAFKRKDHDQHRDGHRYTIVHYCGRQNTIEIRVLPMMDTVDQAIRGVKRVVDITNASLVVLAEREGKVGGKLDGIQGEVYEELIEEDVPLTAGARRRLRDVPG